MALTKTQVSSLYTALLGRASEGNGNTFWQTKADMTTAADAMLDSEAAKAYFGTALNSDADFVAHIYLNTLNKTADGAGGTVADASGLTYWTARLTGDTQGPQLTRAELISTFIDTVNDVQATAPTAASQQWTNRVEVSDHTADTIATTPSDYKTSLAFQNSGTTGLVVTDDAATKTAAEDVVNALPTGTTGEVFILTTGMDTKTGTDNDDIYYGVIDGATAANTTFQSFDTINGGNGSDTLNLSLSDDYDAGAKITNIEVLKVQQTAAGKTVDTDGLEGLTSIVNNRSTDALTISNIESTTTSIDLYKNTGGDDTTATFKGASLLGSTDTANVSIEKSTSVGTLLVNSSTAASFENAVITSIGATDNKIATLKVETSTGGTSSMNKLTVKGAGNLEITNALEFAGSATTAAATVDASTMTGNLKVNVDETTNLKMTVTGGSGDDTITFNDSLDTSDTVDGGAGTDTIVVSTSEEAALTKVTNVEAVKVKTEDIGDGTTITVDGKAVSSAVNFIVDANTATDNDDATVAFTSLDNGDKITIIEAGADSTTLADGVAVTGSVTTDTLDNTLTLALNGIGAVTADTTNDTGVAKVTFDTIETLSIEANKNSTNTVTTNGVEELSVQAATSLVVTGSADLDLDSIVNTSKLVSLDASAATGKLTIGDATHTIDASKLSLKAAQDDTTIFLAGLNNDDHLVGGAGDKDSITATAVTGLTATTGKLNIQDFETVALTATGTNIVDASLMTGVKALAISGASTTTITNVAASGMAVQLGTDTATFNGAAKITVSLADETGTSDALTLNVDNKSAGTTSAKLHTSGIETLNIAFVDDTTANNATVDLTDSKVTNVVATGGAAGAVLALDTLNAVTTSIDTTAYKGDVTLSGANATSAMTVNTAAATTATDITLSAKDDTITVAETGNIAIDIDGGAGTSDTINLNVKTGFKDADELDNFENVNLNIRAGDDITMGANANELDGIVGAKALVVTGGNDLSTLTIGGAGDLLDGTTLLSVDASAFTGNTVLSYDTDKLLATMVLKAGSLATDTINAKIDAANSDLAYNTNGFEIFNAAFTTVNRTHTIDIDKMVGLKTLALSATNAQTAIIVDNYVDTAAIQLGSNVGTHLKSATNVDVNLKSATGTADILNVKLVDTEDTGSIDLDAAGVEVLNLELTTGAESFALDLAGVTATTASNVAINVTGGVSGDGLTISALDSTVNVLDASALEGTLTMTGGSSTATTITGTSQVDTIIMSNAADAINSGSGADTLDINFTSVIGGMSIDLSQTGDQITTFNGASNAAIQTGFQHVDLSGYTGNGAEITAHKDGSTIIGTSETDSITGGAGDDTITGGAGADTITLGAGADTVVFSGLTAGGASQNGSDTISTFGSTDKYDFSGSLTNGAIGNTTNATAITMASTAALAASGTAINVATNRVYLAEVASISKVDTAAEIVTALTDGGVMDAVDFAASAHSYLVVGSTASAEDGTHYVYEIVNNTTAAIATGEVILVGTVTTDVAGVDALTTANFAF